MTQKPLTHASVFSGIGGPEVAASMLGWENLFHCEINPFGKAVLDYWYPNAKSYEDITKTDFTEWRGRVNILTGGFPCQPFSYAGQRRGATDDRYLWPSMYRCIDEIQPDWVVAENVAGILTMVEQGEVSPMEYQAALFDEDNGVRRYQLRETFTLQRISEDLIGHGYDVQPILIPACGVGAPHRRDRVFIVGHRREDATDASANPTCGGEGTPRASKGTKRGGSNADKQSGKWGEQAEWNNRLSAILRPLTDTEHGMLSQFGKLDGVLGESKGEESADGHLYVGVRCSEGRACGQRWESFPTQPAVYRGNDGIPFDVDSLTISFSKWKTEALKAYGNAIVPQVMYEIFRAIEIVENMS
ncbi:MAG: DNA cytosine methyltransferase [Clostridia bacterium]|nr:DNA cytosine methyltransferase [Clostridia bacterium]